MLLSLASLFFGLRRGEGGPCLVLKVAVNQRQPVAWELKNPRLRFRGSGFRSLGFGA